MSPNIQINPLLLTPVPEALSVRLIPDIPHQTRLHTIDFNIRKQLAQKVVMIGPVSTVTGPDRRTVGMVRTPDIVWKDDEVAAVIPGGLVFGHGRVESTSVFIEAPYLTTAWFIQLRSACTAVVESSLLTMEVSEYRANEVFHVHNAKYSPGI
jgi:hypothetical protein